MTAVAAPGSASPWRSGRARVADGVELAYDEQGSGPAMLLIMGIGAQRVFWDDRLCARLVERGFRVIRYDARDIGESSRLDHLKAPPPLPTLGRRIAGLPIDAPYTLSDMARDATQLLTHLGIERAHVVGVSMGGMVAQHLALEFPERVLSLCSIMSAPGARRFFFLTRPFALKTLLTRSPATSRPRPSTWRRCSRRSGGRRSRPTPTRCGRSDASRSRAVRRRAASCATWRRSVRPGTGRSGCAR